MTTIRISTVGAALDRDDKAAIVDRLTGAFAEVEVGRDFPEIRPGFLTVFDRLEPDDLWIGTERAVEVGPSGRAALVTVRVMAGPWTNEMKAELFLRAEAIVREVAAMPREGDGRDFWMTFVEVPEGAWGLGGRTVSIADLAPVFTDDRQARIRKHLE